MSSAPLLRVRGLRVQFGPLGSPVSALDGIDLDVRPGEIVALVGESGSGKSTLGATLIGLLPDSARVGGSADFAGHELVGRSEREFVSLRGGEIGLVPQDPGASLDPVQTIRAQVGEVLRLHGTDRRTTRVQLDARIVELLAEVGIDRPTDRLRQYPHELSGGLKQRVLIAMAFARNPRLLIADEPTSALDVTVQRQVLEVFDRLAREHGTAVIFITHDLALAADHANRIVVLQSGRVREDHETVTVLAEPEHEYTRRLIVEATPRGSTARPVPLASAPAAIEVRGITKRIGAQTILDDVSFSVRPGTTFSLVGESGSGKSTTARSIMRLLDVDEGAILVDGVDVTGYRRAQKRELWRGLQLVYQNPDSSLDPRWRVADLIAEPLRAYGVGSRSDREARVHELLVEVNLPAAFAARRSRELSGGQRQRVAIARALALGARTLVLDEALSALDVLTQAQILDLLARLQADHGLSYLFISHDLHVVRRISHDVGVIHRGRLVETGPVEAVFGDPASAHGAELIAANPGRRIAEAALLRAG